MLLTLIMLNPLLIAYLPVTLIMFFKLAIQNLFHCKYNKWEMKIKNLIHNTNAKYISKFLVSTNYWSFWYTSSFEIDTPQHCTLLSISPKCKPDDVHFALHSVSCSHLDVIYLSCNVH